MKNLYKALVVIVGFGLFAPVATYAEEAAPGVMEVVAIDGTGASEPYAPLYDKFTAVYKKMGSSGQRSLWANVWAGNNAGLAIVTIEYPNMAALAADGAIVSSAEYQALSQEFFQKGYRIASRSIVVKQR